MSRSPFACFIIVVAWLSGGTVLAQPADTVISDAVPVRAFQDARALTVSPAGELYVADAGRDVIQELNGEGTVIRTLGGPGSREGQFDGPSDVDPTNGLVLLVADAGNGRIQRFTNDHLYLGSLPVDRAFESRSGSALRASNRDAAGGGLEGASGTPIAVASSPSGEIFAVDESRGVVLKWNAAHRPERTIGAYDSGDGALIEPVSIALDDRSNIYVGDLGRAAVLLFDAFGNYVRRFADGHASDVRRVVVHEDRLWIVLPHRLMEYELRGRLLRVVDVQLGQPIVDLAFDTQGALLLTPTMLYRTRF